MYPFLLLQFPAILFFTFFFSILVRDSSLRIQNATKNSVHMMSYADNSESESSQIHYFRFQLIARTAWPLFSGIYLSSVLLNIMMICMNVHRSSVTKNDSQMTWVLRNLYRDDDCHPLSITVCAIHDPTGLIWALWNKMKPLLIVLFIKLVCETEGDRFWTLAFSFFIEMSPSWLQKDQKTQGWSFAKMSYCIFFSFLIRETWEVVVSFIFTDNWGWS